MARYITAVHMSGGTQHEHIAEVRWREGGTTSTSTRAQMVEYINNNGEGSVKVADAQGEVNVQVVKANPPYIRTYKDGRPTDNLLNLPRY